MPPKVMLAYRTAPSRTSPDPPEVEKAPTIREHQNRQMNPLTIPSQKAAVSTAEARAWSSTPTARAVAPATAPPIPPQHVGQHEEREDQGHWPASAPSGDPPPSTTGRPDCIRAPIMLGTARRISDGRTGLTSLEAAASLIPVPGRSSSAAVAQCFGLAASKAAFCSADASA